MSMGPAPLGDTPQTPPTPSGQSGPPWPSGPLGQVGLLGRPASHGRVNVLDDPVQIRQAGRDVLSLALMDSRNHLLRLLALDESATALRLAVRAAWYQDHWIARHVQRQRGEHCDPRAPRLAGIEPMADAWLAQGPKSDTAPPTPEQLRAYLAETLEITLDLLDSADRGVEKTDDAMYFYRLALLHEDRLCETLMQRLLIGAPAASADRDALWLPGQRWCLGSAPGGLVPQAERWAHEVVLPEFEIDAQPVNWARYAEFAEDGGYDRQDLWTQAGWAWLQREGRRAPRYVEQIKGGVLVLRGFGKNKGLQRAPAQQPVLHANQHEAQAWCRWAGRRLPTEPEWELAASTTSSRGFVWGDVFEWVAGSASLWTDAAAMPGNIDATPQRDAQGVCSHAVLRGASYASRSRWAHPKARRFARPERDSMFSGFRSCAL
jgi:gamma-glutamyl hercynylcysteine S-oxide synthase